MSVWLYLIFLAALAAQRLVELRISRRNLERVLARGGEEFGQRHFATMRALHTLFFIGCAAEVVLLDRPFTPLLGWAMFAVALAGQGLRYWAMLTLGSAWNVRVVLVPGEAAVTTGPYRYLRHPNYVGVVLEIFAVPLIHGAWLACVVFSALNVCVLWVRIRCEEAALADHSDYGARFGDKPRFVPRPRRPAV